MKTYCHIFFPFLIILAVFTVYHNTIQSPFLFDDYGNIVYNEYIRIKKISGESLSKVWNAPHLSQNRKVSNLSFALNYAYGEYDVRGYHLVNIAIHICCALLAAVFFLQTIRYSWLKTRYGSLSAWMAALIWAIHPIQINAVTYIVQRMTSLAAMFSLLSMIAWMYGRQRWIENSYARAIGGWIFAIAAWILGVLSKEHVVVVPILIAAHEILLLRQKPVRLKRAWIFIGGIVIVVSILLCLHSALWKEIIAGYERRNFTMTERLMTQSRVLWHYVSLFYLPIAERFGILCEYPVSRGLFTPISTIISIASWLAVSVSAWIFRKRYALPIWMISWFFISHLIESTIIPLENIFEHRMYLPSLGVSVASVLMAEDIFSKYFQKPLVQIMLGVSVIGVLGFATHSRNEDFRDEVSLYRSELRKCLDSERIRLNLALALNRAGYFSEGSAMLEQMVREYPDDIVILQNWYNFLMRVKHDSLRAEPIYRHIEELIRMKKYSIYKDAIALQNLAEFFFETADYGKTIFFVEILLEKYYHHASLWLLKGICQAKLDQWELAVKALDQAQKIAPEDAQILYWYGKSLIRTGNRDKGCGVLQNASRHSEDKIVSDLSLKAISDYCD